MNLDFANTMGIDTFIKKYNCDCDYKKSNSYLFIDNVSSIVELEKKG